MEESTKKYPNLTRAGMGAPVKGLKQITTTLKPELIDRVKKFASDRKLRINEAITMLFELGLRSAHNTEETEHDDEIQGSSQK
jgi:hypothetical protein